MDVNRLKDVLEHSKVNDWQDISGILDLARQKNPSPELSEQEFSSLSAEGAAFITYDFGIDGVSVEIANTLNAWKKFIRVFPSTSSAATSMKKPTLS